MRPVTVTRCHIKSWHFAQESGDLLEEHVLLPREEVTSEHSGGFDNMTLDFYFFFSVQSHRIDKNIF